MTTREREVRLRHMFESYRGRLLGEIADKLREARDESREPYLGDMLDLGERFHEEDLQYTLLGMKTETIQRIDEALDRLAEGENADALARITLDTALQGLRAGAGITDELSFECIHTAIEERQS